MRGSKLLAAAVLTCIVAASAGAAAVSAYEPAVTIVPARFELGPIGPARKHHRGELPTKGQTFSFEVNTGGYCAGEPPPVVSTVSVIERAKTAARPFKSTLITATVEHPAHPANIDPSTGTTYNACADLGSASQRRIKLKRPAAELIFFDGSKTPPRRIWPPVRR